MVVYISDPKNSTRELLSLINSFNEVAGYKIKSNKSMAFLYTKNFSREILKLINSFSDVGGYKINSNKSVAFLFTKINRLRKKLGKQHPSQ